MKTSFRFGQSHFAVSLDVGRHVLDLIGLHPIRSLQLHCQKMVLPNVHLMVLAPILYTHPNIFVSSMLMFCILLHIHIARLAQYPLNF